MSIFKNNQDREQLVDFITMSAYDDEDQLTYHEKDNAVSFLYLFDLISGGDDKTIRSLENLLSMQFPAGTIISFTNFGSPYLPAAINPYMQARYDTPTANETVRIAKYGAEQRAEYIAYGAMNRQIESVDTKVISTLGYCAIKIPLKIKNPFSGGETTELTYKREVREIKEMLVSFKAAAEVLHIKLREASLDETLAVIRRYFKPFGAWDTEVDESLLMNEQVMPVGATMSWNKMRNEDLHFSNFDTKGSKNYAGILTIDQYPKRKHGFGWWRMLDMLGSRDGRGIQIGMPYALTTTIHFPDQQKKGMDLRSGHALTEKQANPQMLKWSPRLREKHQGYEIMNKAIAEHGNIVEVNTSLILFNRSKRELKAACSRMMGYYKNMGMIMGRERYIPAVTFFNLLPNNASPESIKRTYRFKTMASQHAAHLLPILDDWQGYGRKKNGKQYADLLYTTRLGRPFAYSLFSEENKNYSWTMIAGSGGGKSFNLNRIIQDHLSVGVKIYLIDRGMSYFGSGSMQSAQIIDFHKDAEVCLNPFTHIREINDEIPLIMPIFAKMIDESNPLSTDDKALLEAAILAAFTNNGNATDVTDVVNYLKNQSDAGSVRLGRLLHPFSSSGSMGRWFNGVNNFKSDAQWTILELQGLKSNPHLQQVVLMSLAVTINQEMYATENAGQMKMLILEEAGDLMEDENFASFVAKMYSKLRKEVGSVGMVYQSSVQPYQAANGKYGKIIMASAGTQFFLQQSPESITQAIKDGYLEVNQYTENQIRSVHTVKGQYSEMAIKTEHGIGVVRLIENPFNRVLFSTEGETFVEIKNRVQRGENVSDMVEEEARKAYPKYYHDYDALKKQGQSFLSEMA